jgi:hypothetical protein
MTHQHNSNGREWLMVEVPEDARDIQYYPNSNTIDYWKHDHTTSSGEVQLPSGTWRIHSDSLTITEEQAGEIVDKSHYNRSLYKDYQFGGIQVEAITSYRSLLRSKQINSRVINLVRI